MITQLNSLKRHIGLIFFTMYILLFSILSGQTPKNPNYLSTSQQPDISVSPDSLNADLLTGQVSSQILTISNSGQSDLTFDIFIQEVGTPLFSQAELPDFLQVSLVEIRKGEQDTRVYPQVLRGAGGPDAFGYSWKDSNEPGGPTFELVDVSEGTPIFLDDDDFVTDIPLGFTFNYYGLEFIKWAWEPMAG